MKKNPGKAHIMECLKTLVKLHNCLSSHIFKVTIEEIAP